MRIALLVAVTIGLMFGCGQRGDLYLRDDPPAGVKPPKSGAHKPPPYPQSVGEQPGAEQKP